MKVIDIYLINKDNRVCGTVGWFYYSKLSIKELIDMYTPQGYRLRF